VGGWAVVSDKKRLQRVEKQRPQWYCINGLWVLLFAFCYIQKKKRGSAHYSRTEHAFKKKEKSKKELRRQRNSGSGGEQVWGSEYCSGPSSNPKFSFG
jgi:hypothetical protein